MSVNAELIALQRALAGRYSIERELGRGGMGIVFLARDVALDRLVAIKLLPRELAAKPELRAMFLSEARIAARLAHPNIVPIHAVEEHGDLVCFVMMYVDGDTLGTRVRRDGPIGGNLGTLVQEIAWALAHAHAHGVIHRDIKPDNILLERGTGRALVTDFGIARVVQSLDKGGGVPMGTPAYMSPEQARGETLDGRSDLYSLGATAFFAATGRPPFTAANATGLLVQHASHPAPPLASVAPRVPASLAALVDRLLAKTPAERPASGEDVAAEVLRGRGSEMPVPTAVRQYLQEAESIGGEVGMYVAISVAATGAMEVLKWVQGDFMGLGTTTQIVVSVTLLGVAAVRIAQLWLSTRRLAAQGYRHAHVAPALVLHQRADEARPRRFTPGTALVVVACLAIMALGLYVSETSSVIVLEAMGWLAAIIAPMEAIRRVLRDTIAGGPKRLWQRWLAGRPGRWFFQSASIGQHAPQLPAEEPTVMALGRATEAAFAALPPGQQRQLAQLPEVVARLQADVLQLRAGPAGGDGRVAIAVGALENLRMDLLRLAAGEGVGEGLTQDIEAAQRIGEDIRALLHATDPKA